MFTTKVHPQALSATPFEAPADLARLLATLPEESLQDVVEFQARQGNASWLRIALDVGYLATESLIAENRGSLAADPWTVQSRWTDRCHSILCVMHRAERVEAVSTNGYFYDRGRFHLDDDAREVFSRVILQIGDGYQAFREAYESKNCDLSAKLVSCAMGLAAMMHREDLLDELIRACPSAVHLPYTDDVTSNYFATQLSNSAKIAQMHPLLVALSFGSAPCVARLLKETDDEATLIVTAEDEFDTSCSTEATLKTLPLNCSAEEFVPVLRFLTSDWEEGDRGDPSTALEEVGWQLADGHPEGEHNRHLLSAFIEVGLFGETPEYCAQSTVRAAIADCPEIVSGLACYDWDLIAAEALEHRDDLAGKIATGALEGVSAMVLAAIEAQRADAVLPIFVTPEAEVRKKVAVGFKQSRDSAPLLTLLMNNGFDPSAKVAGGNVSFAAAIKGANPAIDQEISSRLARLAALQVIADAEPVPAVQMRA